MIDSATSKPESSRVWATVDAIIADVLDRRLPRTIAAGRGVERIMALLAKLTAERSEERPSERSARLNAYIAQRLSAGAVPEQIGPELAPGQPHLWDSIERRARRVRQTLRTMSGTQRPNEVSEAT